MPTRRTSNKKASSKQKLCQKWLEFFLFVNEESANKEALNQYFFENFAQSPKTFFTFIQFFKKKLLGIKGKQMKNEMARKYLSMLSPLCERFGFFQVKNSLDDVCFQIMEPQEYTRIAKILDTYKTSSKKVITNILKKLTQLLREEQYDFAVKGRYKNIYSIHKKLEKRHKKDILNLKDIFAFRIILKTNSFEQCFEVVNLLHDRFQPVADFFKDYITIPKINGYQSVHTGLKNVLPKLHIPIEVQIRTQAMDEYADQGLAAHWLYAKEKQARIVTKKEQQLVEYMHYIADTRDKKQTVHFFSNKGDIFELEDGATILDFAYSLHSEIGNKTKYALVNGREKKVDYTVREGDRIKIVTASKNQCNPSWKQYVHTKNGLKKLKESLKH